MGRHRTKKKHSRAARTYLQEPVDRNKAASPILPFYRVPLFLPTSQFHFQFHFHPPGQPSRRFCATHASGQKSGYTYPLYGSKVLEDLLHCKILVPALVVGGQATRQTGDHRPVSSSKNRNTSVRNAEPHIDLLARACQLICLNAREQTAANCLGDVRMGRFFLVARQDFLIIYT